MRINIVRTSKTAILMLIPLPVLAAGSGSSSSSSSSSYNSISSSSSSISSSSSDSNSTLHNANIKHIAHLPNSMRNILPQTSSLHRVQFIILALSALLRMSLWPKYIRSNIKHGIYIHQTINRLYIQLPSLVIILPLSSTTTKRMGYFLQLLSKASCRPTSSNYYDY